MNSQVRILVIDDDESICEMLEDELNLCGFRVRCAKSGKAGIKLAKKYKPDVILLDWMMPEMSGLEVLSKLKHKENTEAIPVFMMTAKGKIGDIDRAYDIGVDDYIIKPFELLKIGNTIKRKLQKLAEIKAKQTERQLT